MSGQWSLSTVLAGLHESVEGELRRARESIGHPTDKGDASETVWIDVFNRHLPRRYEARKAHVVDSEGHFSDQIDVVIHDRQYSPLVLSFKDTFVVPAESVYAIFEAKQDMTAEHIEYAQRKVASVRRLRRTSLPVPTVDGIKPPKEPGRIIGGILTLACSWSPPFGETMLSHLMKNRDDGFLDVGCVADSGMFLTNADREFSLMPSSRAATRFILELIARLQELATAPMIDIRAYARHVP